VRHVRYRLQVAEYGLQEFQKVRMDTEIRFAEESEARLVDRRRKVWLECDGEPYDFRAVRVRGTDFLVRDIALVRFVCPRCGKNHQSLLFS
jgi:hypothetical protein